MEFPVLGQGNPNVFGNALEAYNMGRQLARQRGVQDALSQASTDPEVAKRQLTKYGAFDELRALEEQAAKARAMQLGKVATTDPRAAQDQALAAGDFDLAKTFQGLDDQKKAVAQKNLGLAARVGAKLLETIPADPNNPQASLEARKAKLQELLPSINQALGHDELDVEALDLTDAGIQNLLASAESIGAYQPAENMQIVNTPRGPVRVDKASGEAKLLYDAGPKVPAGFRQTEAGDLEPIPGGPADLGYIAKKRPPRVGRGGGKRSAQVMSTEELLAALGGN